MVESVYQYFDARGRLLYVGVTARNVRRAQEHAETKDWWPQATGCTLEHFDTRELALARERELIERHAPPYNTVHNASKAAALQFHAPITPGAGDQARRPKRRPAWQRRLIAAERAAAEEGYVPRF